MKQEEKNFNAIERYIKQLEKKVTDLKIKLDCKNKEIEILKNRR